MKKLLATVFLLLSVSIVYAGAPREAVPSTMVCHDKKGNWAPQDKNCDPNSCGCLFHQIWDFVTEAFD